MILHAWRRVFLFRRCLALELGLGLELGMELGLGLGGRDSVYLGFMCPCGVFLFSGEGGRSGLVVVYRVGGF